MSNPVARLNSELSGRYAIEQEIGRGGMAAVYRARDLRHGRSVALKILHPEIAAAVGHERFLREVALAARLQHPHILTVHDSGEIPASGTEPPLLWYTMPMVDGETLRARLAREGQLPVADAVRIGSEVADALAYAHREGIVHRDIKPENLLLAGRHAFVADFGIARAAGDDIEHLTLTGMALGTPAYMSPEQASGGTVDARTDIYSLGVVLYEMLAGELPFTGSSPQQLIARMMTEEPRPLAAVRPSVSESLHALVHAALSRTPADRPDAAELAARLGDSTASRGEPRAAYAKPSAPHSKRRYWPLAAAGVLAAAIVAVALVVWPSEAGSGELQPNLVAIAPFQLVGAADGLDVWSEGVVDLLARYVDGAGTLRVVAPTRAVRAWRGGSSREEAAEFGQNLSARYVIYGQMVGSGDSVRLSSFLVDASDSSLVSEREWRGSTDGIARLTDSVATHFLGVLGRPSRERSVGGDPIGTSDPRALRAFLSGMRDLRRASYRSAAEQFLQSVAADTGFVLGRLYAAQAMGWTATVADTMRIRLILEAAARNKGLNRRDSLLIAGDSLNAQTFLGRTPPYAQFLGLERVMTALMDEYWDDPEVVYWVADESFHTNPLGMTDRWHLEQFKRVVEMDSLFAPAYEHVVELSAMFDPPEETRRYIARMRAVPELDSLRFAALGLASHLLQPDLTEAELRSAVDSAPPGVVHRAYVYLSLSPDTLPLSLVRAYSALDPTASWVRLAQPLQEVYHGRLTAAAESWRAVRLPWGRMSIARDLVTAGALPMSELNGVADELGDASGAKIIAMPLWATFGDTSRLLRMEEAFRELAAESPPEQRGFMTEVVGIIADARRLAAGDSAPLLQRVTDSHGARGTRGFRAGSPLGVWLIELLLAAGHEDAAWNLLQSRTARPQSIDANMWRLHRARLAERRGERDTAIEEYAFIARLWRDADEPLKSLAIESREAVARLTAEPR